jgi:hypothetical protein
MLIINFAGQWTMYDQPPRGIKMPPGFKRGRLFKALVSFACLFFIGQGRLAFHGPDSFQRIGWIGLVFLLEYWTWLKL